MNFPNIKNSEKLTSGSKRLFIAAYGFEDRSLGWVKYQKGQDDILKDAILIKYLNPKGNNKIKQLIDNLKALGVIRPSEINYDLFSPHNIESLIEKKFSKSIAAYDEIIIDITAMTKFLILICLCKLDQYKGRLRIVYTEAMDYAPTRMAYTNSKEKMEELAKFPSRGFETILRAKCLSSIRMQGQPVALVAFTSFNEQLIRHMLGTINPHRLLFINGKPPRNDFNWREIATQEINSKLIDEYPTGNEIGTNKLLKRKASTLNYMETIEELDKIYDIYGMYERIIVAATGSKMQTVGLFFSKILHPDIHIEYPTPDSYFVKGMSIGIRKIHEIEFESFSNFLSTLNRKRIIETV